MRTDLELIEEVLECLERDHPENYNSRFTGLCYFIKLKPNLSHRERVKAKDILFKYGPKKEDWKGHLFSDGSGYFYPVGEIKPRRELLKEIIVKLKKI